MHAEKAEILCCVTAAVNGDFASVWNCDVLVPKACGCLALIPCF